MPPTSSSSASTAVPSSTKPKDATPNTPNTASDTSGVNAAGIDFSQYANEGFEGMKQGDFQTPFLVTLQDLSPAVKRNDGGYVEGAEVGMIMNSVTKRLYDVFTGKVGAAKETGFEKELYVIPVHFVKVWTEWNKRKFVQHHATAEILKDTVKGGKNEVENVLKNGNTIVETAMHSVFVVTATGSLYPALISLNKTQLKKSKVWNSLMADIKMPDGHGGEFTPPPYSHVYKVTTVTEKNDENTWPGWKFAVAGPVTSAEMFKKTRTFALELKANPSLALPSTAAESEQEALPERRVPSADLDKKAPY